MQSTESMLSDETHIQEVVLQTPNAILHGVVEKFNRENLPVDAVVCTENKD